MEKLSRKACGVGVGWLFCGQCHSGSGLKPVEVMFEAARKEEEKRYPASRFEFEKNCVETSIRKDMTGTREIESTSLPRMMTSQLTIAAKMIIFRVII